LNCPLSFHIEKAPDDLQLELIVPYSDIGLKEKFNSLKCADLFGLLCDAKYRMTKALEQMCYHFCAQIELTKRKTFSLMDLQIKLLGAVDR
jgi:hypothetical protein